MAKVKVEAKLGIARYLPGEQGDTEVEVAAGEKVGELLDRLGVPRNAVALVLVNQEKAEMETALVEGDLVALLPLIVGG
ncbi:MAG: MoaD/ThiS family protein [Planctomycetota bacterium]|jgi:molybdopterin converting factor small subunit